MQVKTYRAANLADALARASRELGPDALVLSTRTIEGRHGLPMTEITVARRDDERHRVPEETTDELRRIASGVRRLQTRTADVPRRAEPRSAPVATLDDLPRALRPAADALIGSGVPEDLALRFAATAARGLPDGAGAEHVARATERGVAALFRFGNDTLHRGARGAEVTFVVGPPGAGKTTTAAKLAAHDALRERRSVVMAQTDHEKVGAHHQTEIFASHIGAAYVPVDDRDDLRVACARAGVDGHVVVDTPGIGANDDARLERIAALRRARPGARLLLAIPNGLHADTVEAILARFDRLHPTSVVLTKVDDGPRPGELLAPIRRAELPISYLTDGHRVPDDLRPADARALTALLLRSGHTRGETIR